MKNNLKREKNFYIYVYKLKEYVFLHSLVEFIVEYISVIARILFI